MSKYNYEGSKQFKPISAWGFVGYSILFSIPIIGWIMLIVFAFSDRNINRRSFARSYFCWLLIAIIIGILLSTGVVSGLMSDSVKSWISTAQDTVQGYIRTAPSTVKPKAVENDAAPQENPSEPTAGNEIPEENSSQENDKAVHEYTLRNGKYIIGKDIAPGTYIISCTETAGESAGNAYGSMGNMLDAIDGNSNGNWSDAYGALGGLMKEYINMTVEILGDYGNVLQSYDMKKGDSLSIQLKEGTAIQITDGSCTITSK